MECSRILALALAVGLTVVPDGRGAAAEDTPAPVNPYKGKQKREEVFEFTQKPKVEKKNDKWVISFASKGRCDATVAVLDKDGKIVCHLASGVLGRNAPSPFQQNSLSQEIEWDGRDELGKPAPAGCRVRVGLGLKATYAWTAPLLKDDKPIPPVGNLSTEEEKAWPKLRTPEGGSVLVPDNKVTAIGFVKPGLKYKASEGSLRNQIAVDRGREEVYVGRPQRSFNTVFHRLGGKTGRYDGFKIKAMELAVSPENGLLYVRDMKAKKKHKIDYWGVHFLRRCDHDGKPVPLKSPNADPDGEVVLPSDRSSHSFGAGMAFRPNGELYILCNQRPGKPGSLVKYEHPVPALFIFDNEGSSKPFRRFEYNSEREKAGPKPIRILDKDGKEAKDPGWYVDVARGSCGVGADRYGNFYIGSTFRPIGKLYPEDLVGSPDLPKPGAKVKGLSFYRNFTGTVIKFSRDEARVTDVGKPTHWYTTFAWGRGIHKREVCVHGALWTYTGLSPITARGTHTCICPQSRLDVDCFGRVYVPQLHRQAVLILDPNGNPILRVGKYGNADVEMKGEDIRMVCPGSVGASDTAFYVIDRSLCRVLKAKLEYHTEDTVAVPL